MPKFPKGSQEAKDYMKSIREMKTTNTNIKYETAKGKKSQKNITINLEKDTERLPNGDQIIKSTIKKKMNKPEVEAEAEGEPEQPEQSKKKGGRPKKYASAEEAKKAKRLQTLASNKKKYQEKKAKKNEEVEGGRIGFTNLFKRKQSQIPEQPKPSVYQRLKNYSSAIIYGRKDFPPRVRKILDKVGNKQIKHITIKRTPISSVFSGSVALFTTTNTGEKKLKNYDELFHLFIEMTTDDNVRVLLEKNEVINMELNPKIRPNTESEEVVGQMPNKTIREMLKSTEERMGIDNFFGYSASDNNCQDFIMAFFKANNIGDESDYTFIKQDTEYIFKNSPYLKSLSKFFTDIAGRVDVIRTGAGIDDIKNYSDVLNHLVEHITDPKEPIDPRDFKQAVEMINAIKRQKENIKGKGLKEKNYVVQSVIFEKDKFNIPTAKKWLKTNGYKSPKVDREENTLRFRQIEPSVVEKEGFKEYRIKELGNSGIKLVLAYKKNIISTDNIGMSGGKLEVHHYHHIIHPKSDEEESDTEMEGEGIGRAFKKLGKTVKKGFTKDIIKPVSKIIDKTGDYVGSKKGGLATDLINYGIPATTGAVLGALGSATGNPALGALGNATGNKLAKELIVPEIHKASGAGVKNKRMVKGSKEAREHMAKLRSMKGKGVSKSDVIVGKVY